MTGEKLIILLIGFAAGYFVAMSLIWIFRTRIKDLEKSVADEVMERIKERFRKIRQMNSNNAE